MKITVSAQSTKPGGPRNHALQLQGISEGVMAPLNRTNRPIVAPIPTNTGKLLLLTFGFHTGGTTLSQGMR